MCHEYADVIYFLPILMVEKLGARTFFFLKQIYFSYDFSRWTGRNTLMGCDRGRDAAAGIKFAPLSVQFDKDISALCDVGRISFEMGGSASKA